MKRQAWGPTTTGWILAAVGSSSRLRLRWDRLIHYRIATPTRLACFAAQQFGQLVNQGQGGAHAGFSLLASDVLRKWRQDVGGRFGSAADAPAVRGLLWQANLEALLELEADDRLIVMTPSCDSTAGKPSPPTIAVASRPSAPSW